jgi:hypothetical protein
MLWSRVAQIFIGNFVGNFSSNKPKQGQTRSDKVKKTPATSLVNKVTQLPPRPPRLARDFGFLLGARRDNPLVGL